VHDHRERIDRIAVHEDVELDERRLPVAGHVIVERRVAARNGLQAIVEVQHDFVERQLVRDEHAVLGDVLQALLDAALLLAQLENAADVLVRRQHHGGNDRLLELRDAARIRKLGGTVHSTSVPSVIVTRYRHARAVVIRS
jgi:hypothetical protein